MIYYKYITVSVMYLFYLLCRCVFTQYRPHVSLVELYEWVTN